MAHMVLAITAFAAGVFAFPAIAPIYDGLTQTFIRLTQNVVL